MVIERSSLVNGWISKKLYTIMDRPDLSTAKDTECIERDPVSPAKKPS